ncbi:MAG: N-formylglutamate amidohydrolase [Ectothiorhodospiraceae bacterium]|nr:N-formylglutamate amidohydrolase [Ectothiorhodospiraceae bacterium]
MSRLPFLISVPHAGIIIPHEVRHLNLLRRDEIVADTDVTADAIYAQLEPHVLRYASSHIARAFVDLNRAEDDIRKDGVVKTHTCWDVPIYSEPLEDETIASLLRDYHRPYHNLLTKYAGEGPIFGIDCHTMAAVGPPVAPDTGKRRPKVNLGDVYGTSCPAEWVQLLCDCLSEVFGEETSLNVPFAGGWITRTHASEIPWVQLELSREAWEPPEIKGQRLLRALQMFEDKR